MRTVAVIQARTGSTRLPSKVLRPLLGQPVLWHVMRRVSKAREIDEAVVATTTEPADDAIETLGHAIGHPVVRGSSMDLLDRYVQAAREHDADVVVRITSDCPLIDPTLIDETIAAFRAVRCDYGSNSLEPRTYPRGLDVEVIRRDALERAWEMDLDPARREHATPYIYGHPEIFALARVANDVDYSAHRWCVDTPEDLELVRRIFEAIGQPDFGWRDALAVVEANPAWSELNRHVVQKQIETW